MRKRTTRKDDYIEGLARAIEAERAQDPEAALPWDWWRRQAELYGVTPNNIYSRAVSRGLYTPPSRRTEPSAASPRVDQEKPGLETPRPSAPRPAPPRAAAKVLTERLQAMADVTGLLGEMETRIGELEREKETNDARSREALRALDRLGRVLGEAIETISALKQLYRE